MKHFKPKGSTTPTDKSGENFRNSDNSKLDKVVNEANDAILGSDVPQTTLTNDVLTVRKNTATITDVNQQVFNDLEGSEIDTGKLSMTVTANVNNLYNAEGYSGIKLIGESLDVKFTQPEETDSTILSDTFFQDLASTDVIPNGTKLHDVMSGSINFKNAVKFKPVSHNTFYKHFHFGITSLARDNSLMTETFISQIVSLLGRAQAQALTDSEVLLYDDITIPVHGVQTAVPAVVFLWWYDIKIGSALSNVIIMLKNFKNMLLENSQYSLSAKHYADVVLSQWMKTSNQAVITDFMNTTSLVGSLKEYEATIHEAFSATSKDRTGRIAPSTSSYQLSYLDNDDKKSISFNGVEILPKDFVQGIIYDCNTIVVFLVSLAKRLPLRDIHNDWSDVLKTSFTDNVPTIADILKLLTNVSQKLITYLHRMTAYTKFREVLISAGFLNKFKMLNFKDESLTYPAHNKPCAKFMIQLAKSVGTPFDYGIRVDTYLDFSNVKTFLGNSLINALYAETDEDARLLHTPIVMMPKGVYSITSWYGYYHLNLNDKNLVNGVDMPNMTVEPWDPGINNITVGNNNVALVNGSITSLAYADIFPIYSYNRRGVIGKGVITASTFFGTISQLVPSLTESLLNYLITNNIGGSDA